MKPHLINPPDLSGAHYDLVVVGSGFGSGFFLSGVLARSGFRKILVLERGDHHPHEWQLANEMNSTVRAADTYEDRSDKPWNFTIGFGGGTNCWYGQTPRFHPSDFKLKTRYGVGNDWPIDYDDLEPYYAQAEALMSISGDPDMGTMFPRSTPFPLPPHRPSAVDRLMKAAQPHQHFIMPTARASVATEQRPACCASFRCNICPADAKFTANNGLRSVFEDERVSVALNAHVSRFETAGGVVKSVEFAHQGRDYKVSADLFVLGANAIHSPAILLRSGMDSPLTGKGLHESHGADLEVLLDGVDNFDGSTITTGLNFGLYDHALRSEYAAAMVYFENRWLYGLRTEPGKWRQTVPIMIVTEELLEDHNRITVPNGEPGSKPIVTYSGPSDYARIGLEKAIEKLPALLAPLPVERIVFRGLRPTESHLQGTLRMGSDPAHSVVDDRMVHHRYRNLVAVGTSVFATSSCANPSLTAAALSLRSASLIL
jgi:choline dehydrogenase-like flavoprotein